jgi:hypothetical protein
MFATTAIFMISQPTTNVVKIGLTASFRKTAPTSAITFARQAEALPQTPAPPNHRPISLTLSMPSLKNDALMRRKD